MFRPCGPLGLSHFLPRQSVVGRVFSLAIKLCCGGSLLFTRHRAGLMGWLFMILKFRSMSVDAEARLAGLHGGASCKGPLFKLRRDSRGTCAGSVIRKCRTAGAVLHRKGAY